MKGNMFVVQILDNNKVINEKKFKTLRDIEREYSNIEYAQLRGIYLQSMGLAKRNQHPHIKELYSIMHIIDSTEYKNNAIEEVKAIRI
jgi:hypothetical protein